MVMKFFLILLISFSSVYLDSNESNIASKINQVLPEGMSVQSVRRSQIDNLYIVDIGDLQPIYASENGDFFLYGELFGIKNGNLKNMTNIEVNLKRKKILNENLIQDDFISFNANYEKHVVTIFTDVDCGYCRKLHNEIKDYNDQGISVKYVAFPRSGLESDSYEKIVTAWCADDQRAALTQMKQGIDLDISMCSNHPVEKHYLLGQRIGITGTPAIITSSGELLPGYLPPLDLLERLD
jgi:thiol:disulfide interchange protein DsbC